ncbi:hypothetical protein BP6252_09871 [Coleophoma cylindrospora]|uniref:Uncharacterized protein n=1 Tax=Coleophoma cylindrospora TaxID=1849047 RepID=A0A3D8QWR9_9HELO|nr:hypothetical protein BP6252_09871 [Coleophoma cylindrospora]
MAHKFSPPDLSSNSFSDYLVILCVGRNARYALERKRTLQYFRSITPENALFYPSQKASVDQLSPSIEEIVAEEPARASNVSPWKAPLEVTYRYRLSIPNPKSDSRTSSESCWYEAYKRKNERDLVGFRHMFMEPSDDVDSGHESAIVSKSLDTRSRLQSSSGSVTAVSPSASLSSNTDNPLRYFLEIPHAAPAGSNSTIATSSTLHFEETCKEEDKKWLLTSILGKIDTAGRYDEFLYYPEMVEFIELVCLLVAGHHSTTGGRKALCQQTIDLLRIKVRCSQIPRTPDFSDASELLVGRLLSQCTLEELVHMESTVRDMLEKLPDYKDKPTKEDTPIEYITVNTSLGRMRMSKNYPVDWDYGGLATKYCAW